MMLKFIVFLSFAAYNLGAAIPEKKPRIIGGTTTIIERFPYQISLQIDGEHWCGGSIYSKTVIVTAAHCLKYNPSVSSLSIRAGSSYRNSGGVVIGVASFKKHPDYNPKNFGNDIAVIHLSSPLNYSADIQSIGLASSTPVRGDRAIVSGWGTTAFKGLGSEQLQYAYVSIVDRFKCASSPNYGSSRITNSMICAYGVGKDACQEDSGGPLVSEGVLVGVVSWGYKCADRKHPGVYADVAQFRSWIIDNSLAGVE